MVCVHHGKGSVLGIACLGITEQKQYEDVPGASAHRLDKEDLIRGAGLSLIFQLACHQQSDDESVCPVFNSAKTQFLHPPSPVSNELDIQRKCLQKRSQEGGGISLTAPALPAPALSFQTRDQDSGLVSLGAPALPTCLPFPQRHSPGPASFSCCPHCWPLRMKDLVPSSTMRRRVENPRDRHPDVALAAL